MKINSSKIKKASLKLSAASEKQKNTFLRYLADELILSKEDIVQANQTDIKNAIEDKLHEAFIERLKLEASGIKKLIQRVKNIEKLQSRVGKVLTIKKLANGLILKKIAVPIGIILAIYEARPEVTIDVAVLCIKSGNAVILKGGSEALVTSLVLNKCIQKALERSCFAKETVNFISGRNRQGIKSLLKKCEVIDLVVARGGHDLVKFVYAHSTIAVLAHAAGGARIYIDKSADINLVEKIIINAKISKPSACNSLDTIVIHKKIAGDILPKIVEALRIFKIKIVGDGQARKIVKINKATSQDWGTEYLDSKIAIKIVANLKDALNFINRYSKRHSEGIITDDKSIIAKFTQAIDAASIFVNCSTRLHDGEVFGFGAEMGISTSKLHARGPVGLMELTSFKWIIEGKGQVRS